MGAGRGHRETLNLLEIRPRQSTRWETTEEGLVVLLVPRFQSRRLHRWMEAILVTPYVRVKLDRFGSFVWKQCDGATPVSTIAERMLAEFGPRAEPVYDRLGAFIRSLERESFLDVRRDGHTPDRATGA